MTIQQLWHVGMSPTAVEDELHADEQYLVELLAACSNAHVETVDGEEKMIGDPTEGALVRLAQNKGATKAVIEERYPRVHELPFDSTRKRMTTVHKVGDEFLSVTKGAFDRIPVIWDNVLKKEAKEIHDDFAKNALRVIAVGYKQYGQLPEDLSEEELEKDVTLLGLVGMIDPPRPESRDAVSRAKEAGIRTVMITGDHVKTAVAIAKQIGIYEEGDQALTGDCLNTMSDEDLFNEVRNVSVYARVSPEDKIRTVQAWEAHGEVIAMTGDGVNDAPALKAADVGVAMGIAGTEVSKNAADMVITDDNFATIVDAISEGRTAYDNIRKTVYFLLSVNFAQIFIMLSGMIVWGYAPIVAVQILLINVVSDGIPGFFLAFEKAEEGVMKRKPLPKNAGIFANQLGFKIAQRSATFAILTLLAFYIGSNVQVGSQIPSNAVGVSMAFITLSWASVINIFNIRSEKSIFKIGFLSNRAVFLAALASMTITAIVGLVPFIANVFQVVPLDIEHWLIVAGLSAMQLVSCEIIKLFSKN